MSSTQALIAVLKAELKAAGLTYAALARALGLAESSVKRMLAQGDMPLARIDAICAVLGTDFTTLARRVAAAPRSRHGLTPEQEAAVVADPRLLVVALCALSTSGRCRRGVATYRLSEAEAIACLAQLDRLGIIELRPHNRYRLHVAKTFRWRPDGPVMHYVRERVVGDYFAGGFDGEGEQLMLVHGQIDRQQATRFNDALQRLAEDFAQQHLADQPLPAERKRAYTLMLGMRSWLFAGLRDMRRDDGQAAAAPPPAAPPAPPPATTPAALRRSAR